MSQGWLNRQLPGLPVLPITTLLRGENGLEVTAANGSKIPYKGYVEVKCSLAESPGTEVTIPMLVTQGNGEQPIIGYNVIEELIKCEHQHDKDTTESDTRTTAKSYESYLSHSQIRQYSSTGRVGEVSRPRYSWHSQDYQEGHHHP